MGEAAAQEAAHRLIAHLLDQGEDEIRLLGAVVYQLRSLIRVCDLQGLAVPAIIKHTHLPPFVVKRCLQQVSRVERHQLVSAYQYLVKIDHQINTGAMRSSDALELMVANVWRTSSPAQ